MLGEEVEEFVVHERFAAEDAEERVAMRLGLVDHPVELVKIDFGFGFIDIDPAPLATEVAGVDDGKVKERGEKDPLAEAFLVKIDGTHAFDAEVP